MRNIFFRSKPKLYRNLFIKRSAMNFISKVIKYFHKKNYNSAIPEHIMKSDIKGIL